jgi:hypothetical protein
MWFGRIADFPCARMHDYQKGSPSPPTAVMARPALVLPWLIIGFTWWDVCVCCVVCL